MPGIGYMPMCFSASNTPVRRSKVVSNVHQQTMPLKAASASVMPQARKNNPKNFMGTVELKKSRGCGSCGGGR